MSTTQKYKAFVAEPMRDKPVKELAGIGQALGGRLEESGFSKCFHVLGQFLVLNKDEEAFRAWLKNTCGANAEQQVDCYNCINDWCDQHL